MILEEQLARCAERFRQAGVENPRRDARLLLAHALGTSVEALIAEPDERLSPTEVCKIEALSRRREGREPLSRIIGEREFWSLSFAVTPSVLDPRPESETLIELVLSKLAGRGDATEILDLGTGSGCLLLALLNDLPNARGLGLDISAGAVEAARRNAASLGLSGRARFEKGDWNRNVEGRWQIVVCNPPYIETSAIGTLEPEVREFDPVLALDGGEDGLEAYRAAVPAAVQALAPGGWAAFEVGLGQAPEVVSMFETEGLTEITVAADLARTPRALVGRRSGS